MLFFSFFLQYFSFCFLILSMGNQSEKKEAGAFWPWNTSLFLARNGIAFQVRKQQELPQILLRDVVLHLDLIRLWDEELLL